MAVGSSSRNHISGYDLRFTQVFVRGYVDIITTWTIPIVLILATGIPTALAAHSPAYSAFLDNITSPSARIYI